MELLLLQEKEGFVVMFERFHNYGVIVPTRRIRFYGMFEKFYYYDICNIKCRNKKCKRKIMVHNPIEL